MFVKEMRKAVASRAGMLYLLFLGSGASALIYEVVWVRVFANVFGNTVNVPVNIVLGNDSNLSLSNQIPFVYYSQANRAGLGRY